MTSTTRRATAAIGAARRRDPRDGRPAQATAPAPSDKATGLTYDAWSRCSGPGGSATAPLSRPACPPPGRCVRAASTTPRGRGLLATLVSESGMLYNADEWGTTYTYRGRGYMQLTGGFNWLGDAGTCFGINLLGKPDLAKKALRWSAPIARWYWTVRAYHDECVCRRSRHERRQPQYRLRVELRGGQAPLPAVQSAYQSTSPGSIRRTRSATRAATPGRGHQPVSPPRARRPGLRAARRVALQGGQAGDAPRRNSAPELAARLPQPGRLDADPGAIPSAETDGTGGGLARSSCSTTPAGARRPRIAVFRGRAGSGTHAADEAVTDIEERRLAIGDEFQQPAGAHPDPNAGGGAAPRRHSRVPRRAAPNSSSAFAPKAVSRGLRPRG